MRFKFVLWWTCNSTRTQAKPHVTRDLTSHFGMINVIHSFPLHYCVLLCQVKTLPDEYTLLLKCLPLVCCFFTKQRVTFYLGGEKQHATSLQRQTGKGAAAQHDMTAIDWLNDIYMQRLWRHNQHACFKRHGKLSNMTMYLEQLTSS